MTEGERPAGADGSSSGSGARPAAWLARSAPPRAFVAVFALLPILALLALSYRIATDRVDDHDELWHLATGRTIVETGHVPDRDPFTFTAGDTPWINTNWAAQVVLFRLYQLGGFELDWLLGLALRFGAVALLTLRARAHARSAWAVVPVAFLALSALWTGSTVRPQGWTFFLLAAALLLVDRVRSKARAREAVILGLALALCGQLHGGFVFPFGAVLLSALGEVWEARAPGSRGRRVAALLLGALAIGLASFALHPHGFAALVYPVKYVSDPRVRQMVALTEELRPPHLLEGAGRLTTLWVGSFVVLALVGRPRLRAAEWLTTLAFVGLAFQHARGLHYLSVVLAAPWAKALDATLERARARGPRLIERLTSTLLGLDLAARLFGRGVPGVFAIAVLLGTQWSELNPSAPGDTSAPRLRLQSEVAAVASFLASSHLTQHLFNDFRYGGTLEWAAPEQRTFIDGRNDFHALTGAFADYVKVIHVERDWARVLADRQVDVVLIETGEPLIKALWQARWEFVDDALFLDPVALGSLPGLSQRRIGDAPPDPDRVIVAVCPGSPAAARLRTCRPIQPK